MSGLEMFEKDRFSTTAGDLEITFLGHGSLMIAFQEMAIYIDPFSRVADFEQLPKADLILITHHHRDHLDPEALQHIRTADTVLVLAPVCTKEITGDYVLKNGEACTVKDVHIEAVPAYNLVQQRPNGEPFHKKGVGNGYILTFGDTRMYVAGDTENIPEMKALTGIDIAFLPMNLPYTMTPEMVAGAARTFRPRILYPYHYGSTDTAQLAALLADETGIEVRIRSLA